MIPVFSLCSQELVLPANHVQIWRVGLNLSALVLQKYFLMLSEDEQRRAERFRFDRDRHRFIAARGSLRSILGRYLNLAPEQIQFCYGDHGKPAIAAPETNLQFNLSHSQNLMLCAVGWDCRIGIDLEYLRETADLEQLTQRFFHAQEHNAIHRLPQEQQPQAFFQHWTCKEALLKAIATGLVGLESVEVEVLDNTTKINRLEKDSKPVEEWFLQSFIPDTHCVAAIAVDRRNIALAFWQWQPSDNQE